MCSRKIIEKRNKNKKETFKKCLFILIFVSSVLFVPDRFECPITHLQFNLSFMKKFQTLSDPVDVCSKTYFDKHFNCCSRIFENNNCNY